MKAIIVLLLILGLLVGIYLWFAGEGGGAGAEIPFGPTGDAALGFSELENEYPLTDAHRAMLTPENIEAYDQEHIDQIYARLIAGPIPNGPYRGSFFFADGASARDFGDLLGGLGGMVVDLKLDKLTAIGESLWQGKVFYRKERELRNVIDKESVVAALFDVSVDDMVRDEVFGDQVALLFPAKLSRGKSLFDNRRPSVIIDYAETAEVEGYIEAIDRLAGKDGLQIRDEIRQIRPGFYLGRAYLGTLFGLNFTLYNEEVAGARE